METVKISYSLDDNNGIHEAMHRIKKYIDDGFVIMCVSDDSTWMKEAKYKEVELHKYYKE